MSKIKDFFINIRILGLLFLLGAGLMVQDSINVLKSKRGSV